MLEAAVRTHLQGGANRRSDQISELYSCRSPGDCPAVPARQQHVHRMQSPSVQVYAGARSLLPESKILAISSNASATQRSWSPFANGSNFPEICSKDSQSSSSLRW